MAKLISLDDWKAKRIESEVPRRTLQYWAQQGYIPGARKIGRRWFVDEAVEQNCTGNPLIDQVLMGSR